MDQHNELIFPRQRFVSMFMRGMRARVPYQGIFALFQLIYFVLPMLFVLIIVPLRAMAIITPTLFVGIMIMEGLLSVFIYLRIVFFDCTAMGDCLREIFTTYPALRYDLYRSARLQWADAD